MNNGFEVTDVKDIFHVKPWNHFFIKARGGSTLMIEENIKHTEEVKYLTHEI